MIAGTLTVRYGRVFPINFPELKKTQCNKKIIFCINTRNSALSCKFACTSASFDLKRVPAALFSVNSIEFNRALSRI